MFRIDIYDVARFWSKVNVQRSNADCWEWTASTFPNGYGQFTINGRPLQAHRFAWWHFHGGDSVEPTPLVQVCHSCDNRKCCNPAHLFVGNAKENVRDCMVKGRRAPARSGERSNWAKLTDEIVREIRRRYATNTETYESLGREFGIQTSNVGHIVKRRTWCHVED
jgi:hypothetical protein